MNEHPSGPYLTEKRNWEEDRMRLYLIRHGRQCSQLCNVNVDLALEGFRQAELLGERLAGEKIEAPAICCGRFRLRRRQTASGMWNTL